MGVGHYQEVAERGHGKGLSHGNGEGEPFSEGAVKRKGRKGSQQLSY